MSLIPEQQNKPGRNKGQQSVSRLEREGEVEITKITEETRGTEEAGSSKRKDVDVLDINKKHGNFRR